MAKVNLKISKGHVVDQVTTDVEALIKNGWELDEQQISISKTYHFKLYTKVLDFHHIIGVRSKSENHHATMITKAGSLKVTWTTHDPRGLSAKDTLMAAYCDDQARHIGTVVKKDAYNCESGQAAQM